MRVAALFAFAFCVLLYPTPLATSVNCVVEYKLANHRLWPVRPAPESADIADLHRRFAKNHHAFNQCRKAQLRRE